MTQSGAPTRGTPDETASSVSVTRRSPERTRVLAPGLYAWLLTVMVPAAQQGVPFVARLFAIVAVMTLLVGVFLESERPMLGRWLGIYAFVGCSLMTWYLAGPAIAIGTVEPVRSALGVLGWVIYAFGWGRSRGSRVPEDSPNVLVGAPLAPRARLSKSAAPVVALAIVFALVLEGLAFRVDRSEPALFAHAIATACALLVLGGGSRIALSLGAKNELPGAANRLNATAPPLAALAVLLGLGLVWAAFSR